MLSSIERLQGLIIDLTQHNHKDHLRKFDEKADDGYLLGYSIVSKAFRVFKTRRQQTKEAYHIIFDEILEAIKFLKPLVDNINISELERYPHDEYLHPYEPSQRYQTNSNDVSFIEHNECPKPVVIETEVSSYQNGQIDQNDQSVQNDEILNDDHSKHSNHTNDDQIIDNLPNTKDIQISKHLSFPNAEDTSEQNTTIPSPPLLFPSMVIPAPQDRWSQDKHIKLVNITGFDLNGYSNSDYVGCNMDRKSTSAKAEYVVAASCCANILWMKSQLTDYDIVYEKVFNVYNWILKPNQPKEPPFTNHMKAIYNLDVHVDSKAPKYSSSTEEVPQGKKPGARSMDEGTKNYSFVHILAGSNLSLLVDKTKSARDGLKTNHTTLGASEKSRANDISRKVKLEDLFDILKDTTSAFFTLDSPTDEPIIILDKSEEEENAKKDKDTRDT
nr:hypothetical protein [Tanacetum cinerariifolium]